MQLEALADQIKLIKQQDYAAINTNEQKIALSNIEDQEFEIIDQQIANIMIGLVRFIILIYTHLILLRVDYS